MQLIFVKKHWFLLVIFIITLLAFSFRFYNYQNRWGLAYDQARDVLVTREAIRSHQLPLVGPFASAGAFVYGPYWHWTLLLPVSLFPGQIMAPWVFLTLLTVFVVSGMVLLGREIGDSSLGIIVGLLAALSTAQILQSSDLTQPTLVGVWSFLTLFTFVMHIKRGSYKSGFLLGLLVAIAISTHFQALGLLVLLPVGFLFGKRQLVTLFSMTIGLIVGFLPLIIFDFRSEFFESRGMLDYYYYGQYKIYIPNRWLTYAGEYWPKSWAHIIGGEIIFGYLIIFLLGLTASILFMKRAISKIMIAIIISFLCMFTVLRYYRGERYDGYIVFLHPFVLLLTGWVIWQIAKFNKIAGLFLLCILLIGSLRISIPKIVSASNYASIQSAAWRDVLVKRYPGKTFAVYDFQYKSAGMTLPVVLYLDYANRINDNGYRIGFGEPPKELNLYYTRIIDKEARLDAWDLQKVNHNTLEETKWALINTSKVYDGMQKWYIAKE